MSEEFKNPEQVYPETEIQRAQDAINAMQPDGYLELESVLNSYAEANAIPEAGGIVFTEFEGVHGGVLHATARAPHPTRAAQMIMECLAYLRSVQPETHWRIPDDRKDKRAPAPAPPAPTVATPVQTPVQSAQPEQPQYVDVQASEQPVAAQAITQNVMQITKIEITPRPDARVDVKMWAPGHQWPDLQIINWTAQSVLENIIDPGLGWDISVLQAAAEFTGNFNVAWVHSQKTNQKGVPYKDVKRISLA